MNCLNLFAQEMTDRDAAHDHLAEVFGFPDWYGRNLDALWDLLGDISAPTHIHLYSCQLLSGYGLRMLQVIVRAVAENPSLALTQHYGEQQPL